MATIGYATLDVIPSLRGARQSIDSQLGGQMDASGRAAGNRYGAAAGQEAGSSFSGRFREGIKGLAAPIASLFAGAQVFDFFKQGIEDASGLSEAATKIDAIFGDAASSVQSFSSTAASALGQTQLQALDAAAVFGTFGKAADLSGADLSSFSTNLLTLSTDLASFYNTDVETAIQAIGGGLRGEAEPLRQFGILLDDAALRAEALKLGLIKTTKDALSPQQKVLAANAVIMAQTTDAQGDFARTSGGLANQQRILVAQFSEVRAEVGQKLLPALTTLVTAANDTLIPAFAGVVDFATDAARAFGNLPQPVQTAALAFVALRIAAAAGLGTLVVSAVGTLATAFLGLTSRVLAARNAFVVARAQSGLLAGGLAAVRAGAAGAAAALGAIAKTVLPIAIITTAITVFSKFKQGQEDAKAQVDALTESLEKQTGAITEATRTDVIGALDDAGTLQTARDLGLSLGLVTDAALGSKEALNDLEQQLGIGFQAAGPARDRAQDFLDTIRGQSDALSDAKTSFQLQAEAQRDSTAATADAAPATAKAADALDKQAASIQSVRTELRDLIIAEKERHDALLSTRQDALALEEQISNARDQSREGADKGINARTKAGQENRSALYDLIDQFNNADPKVRNAEGNFERVRSKLLEFADSMGVGEDQAKRLIDQLLRVPKTAPIEFQSKGFKERMAEIRRLREAARELREDAINRINYGPASDTGGIPYGRGGTSPNGSGGAGGSSPKRRGKSVDLGAGGLAAGGSPTIYNYNGNVTYTDDEQGRRRAKNMERRAAGDGSRRR